MEYIKILNLSFVNAFLLKVREGFILIDTGFAIHWDKLENELISAGCLPDKLKLVIITHGDLDHCGNCRKLQKKYGARIAMHKADEPMVRNGLIRKRKIKSFRNKIFFLIRIILKKRLEYERLTPDIYLASGQNLSEYGLDGTVIHLPGHTHGSIGVLTDDGSLFAGDTFTNRKHPNTARLVENQHELEMSLSRLKKMNIKMVYPGHGRPFEINRIIHKL
jgi:hydroxyacylglutathione hydrolase